MSDARKYPLPGTGGRFIRDKSGKPIRQKDPYAMPPKPEPAEKPAVKSTDRKDS